MAERTNATVLKTVEVKASGGSNPPPSATQFDRRRRVLSTSRVVRSLGLVLALAALSACGSDPRSVGTTSSEMSNGTVACGTKNAPPCVPIPTTRVLVSPCGDITTEFLSEALGRSVNLEGSDSTGCAFTAGDLRLGIGVTVHDPYVSGITVENSNPPSQYRVTNNRSGQWFAAGEMTVNGVIYRWELVNYGRGADTYPNTEGPEQRPILEAAAAGLVEAAAHLRPLD